MFNAVAPPAAIRRRGRAPVVVRPTGAHTRLSTVWVGAAASGIAYGRNGYSVCKDFPSESSWLELAPQVREGFDLR
jgi:hypothetical protein